MPYTQRITMFPATGKDAEMRALIEERVRALQAGGVRANLLTTVYSEDRPAFTYSLNFPDLASLEAQRTGPLGVQAPAVQASFGSRLLGLARQAPRIELYEQIVPAPPSPPETRRYQLRNTRMPLAGKTLELTRVIAERANALNTLGTRTTVSVRAAGGHGCVVQTTIIDSLAQLDKIRSINRTDPANAKFVQQLEGLHQGAPLLEVYEILIPQNQA